MAKKITNEYVKMATIGLDKLYYAKINEDSEDSSGNESYATPVALAKVIKADLSVELAEATLYADDAAAEVVKEFKQGKLSLGVDDIGVTAAQALTGATVDDNVAIGFRGKKGNGKYRYFWLYRVIFGVPATNLTTKGDSITFSTPTIEVTVIRRNKEDGQSNQYNFNRA